MTKSLYDLTPAQRRSQFLRASVKAVGVWVLLLSVYFFFPTDVNTLEASVIARLVVGAVLFSLFLGWQLRALNAHEYPQLRAINAVSALAAVFLVGFASIYLALDYAQPGSFTVPMDRVTALYFTTTVLSTVGFGDVSAATAPARLLVTFQMLVDFVLLGAVVRMITATVQRRLTGDERNG